MRGKSKACLSKMSGLEKLVYVLYFIQCFITSFYIIQVVRLIIEESK